MESARIAIDNDNVFNLEHLPTLKGILKSGLTVSVEKDFPKFHDMSLIQYSIAKRKPKTLDSMLNQVIKMGIAEKDILYPKTSNTRWSLLKLAIEFGSENIYDSVDNECLNVIIKAFKEYISKDNKVTGIPLTQAIRYKNDEAVQILIKAGADLLYPLKKDCKSIKSYQLSELPLMELFKMYNDENQLRQKFNIFLTQNQQDDIFLRLKELKVDNNSFRNALDHYKLTDAKEFLSEKYAGLGTLITPDSTQTQQNASNPEPIQPQSNTPTPELDQNSSQTKKRCSECNVETNDIERFMIDGEYKDLCEKCKFKYGLG